MSGFDNIMRTQQMLAPIEMEAGRRRNEGISMVGQAATQIPEMLQRKVESDTRVSMWQTEQEISQYKLQQLRQLDEAGMSRISLESAQEQLSALRMANEQMRKKASYENPQESQRLKRMGMETEILSRRPDLMMGDDGRITATTPDRRKDREREVRELRTGRASRQPVDMGRMTEAIRMSAMAQGAQPVQAEDGNFYWERNVPPEEQERARGILQQARDNDTMRAQAYGQGSSIQSAMIRDKTARIKMQIEAQENKVERLRQASIGARGTDNERAQAKRRYEAAQQELDELHESLMGPQQTVEERMSETLRMLGLGT